MRITVAASSARGTTAANSCSVVDESGGLPHDTVSVRTRAQQENIDVSY